MRIRLPHDSEKFQGGGTTFINNFSKAINKYGHTIVDNTSDYDTLFIAGATLASREEVIKAKTEGKIIILRVDNLLEDRKNRNTGMPRLKEFANLADVIVYQSEWAKKLLSPLIGNGVVINNGVDTDIFYPRTKPKTWDNLRIFYSKYSRNEVKQFHEVQYWWREYCLEKKDDTLVLVGKFADDYLKIEHPFDFHNEEDCEYQGVIMDNKILADSMRGCDVAFLPYMFDACSNTILEAQACGLPIIYSPTGGTPEIVGYGIPINYGFASPVEMVKSAIYTKPPEIDFEVFKNKWGLDAMGEKYDALIKTISGKVYEV